MNVVVDSIIGSQGSLAMFGIKGTDRMAVVDWHYADAVVHELLLSGEVVLDVEEWQVRG